MSDTQIQFNNPNLLNPLNQQGNSVPQGTGITKPFPVEHLPDEIGDYHYKCTMPNHHMHRTDGKRLAFSFGIFRTRDVYDIQYLENELKAGNPFLRRAQADEIHTYNMRTDPRGTMMKELTPEIEAATRVKLEVELRAAMEKRLTSVGLDVTQEQLDMLFGAASAEEENSIQQTDGDKLQSLDVIARLQAVRDSVKSGSGTVLINPTAAMQSSIVGSDKIPNAAG